MVGGIAERLVVVVIAVGPVVTSQVMPEVFGGIEFRGIRRQFDQRHVRGDLERLGRVIAGLIPDQHRVDAGVEFPLHLSQKHIHHAGVQVRGEETDALSRRGTDGGHDIEVVVLGLTNRARTRTFSGPHPGQRALLTESRFVLEPDFDALVGVGLADRLDLIHNFFLKASCAEGSALRCWGRGIKQL